MSSTGQLRGRFVGVLACIWPVLAILASEHTEQMMRAVMRDVVRDVVRECAPGWEVFSDEQYEPNRPNTGHICTQYKP